MGSPTAMFASLMLGLVGGAYLLYGWRQKHIMATVAGLGLSLIPMMVSNPIAIALGGVVLIALPWVVRF